LTSACILCNCLLTKSSKLVSWPPFKGLLDIILVVGVNNFQYNLIVVIGYTSYSSCSADCKYAWIS
jgi:hypothetical protein